MSANPRVAESIHPIAIGHSRRRVSSTFVLRFGCVGLEFLCGLLLARLLKANGYGVYAYVMAWVGILAVPATAGFDRLLVREIAVTAAQSRWGAVRTLVKSSTSVVLTGATVVSILLATVASIFARQDAELYRAFLAGAVLIPLLAYARLRQAALQGMGHVFAGQLPESLVQPAALLVITFLCLMICDGTLSGAHGVLLQLGAVASACAFGLLLLRAKLPVASPHEPPGSLTRIQLKSALPFAWMLAMNMALINLDTITVGALRLSVEAGVYRVASQMAAFVMFPLTAVNLVFAPSIATLYRDGKFAKLQATVTHGARIAFAGAAIIVLCLLIAGKPLLRLFGPEFADGYMALTILSGAYLLNSAIGVAGYLLIMTRFERDAAACFTGAVIVDAVICLSLVPTLGIVGAAIGTATGIIVLGLGMLLCARHRLGISSFALAQKESER